MKNNYPQVLGGCMLGTLSTIEKEGLMEGGNWGMLTKVY